MSADSIATLRPSLCGAGSATNVNQQLHDFLRTAALENPNAFDSDDGSEEADSSVGTSADSGDGRSGRKSVHNQTIGSGSVSSGSTSPVARDLAGIDLGRDGATSGHGRRHRNQEATDDEEDDAHRGAQEGPEYKAKSDGHQDRENNDDRQKHKAEALQLDEQCSAHDTDFPAGSSAAWQGAKDDAMKDVQKRNGQKRRFLGRLAEKKKNEKSGWKTSETDPLHVIPKEISEAQHSDMDEDAELVKHIDSEVFEGWSRLAKSDVPSTPNSLNISSEEDLSEGAGASTDDPSYFQNTPGASSEAHSQRMLEALISEFGDLDSQRPSDTPAEKFLYNMTAGLHMSVIVRGSLMLTTRRLAFVAILPHLQGTDAKEEDKRAEIIRQGAIELHFPGWRRHRRAWMELRRDSLVVYRNSTSLYRPIGSGRLSDMELMPLDWSPAGKSKPGSSKIHLRAIPTGLVYAIQLASHEAANWWHKDLEAAIWSSHTSRERIRISIPLERLAGKNVRDVHPFVNINLAVIVNPSRTDDADLNKPRWETTDVNFFILRTSDAFFEKLNSYYEQAAEIRRKEGLASILSRTPCPIIEIERPRERRHEVDADPISVPNQESLPPKIKTLFTLHDKPEDLKLVKADLVRTLPLTGTLVLAQDFLIFWRHRLPPFADTRIKIPIVHLIGVEATKVLRWHFYGLKVHIRSHPSLTFEFRDAHQRDMTMKTLETVISNPKSLGQQKAASAMERSVEEHDSSFETLLQPMNRELRAILPAESLSIMPPLINPPAGTQVRLEPMRIICLTIGSRGDCQPYIALAKGLKQQGHSPVIVSHPEYKDWVNKHGIDFRPAGGDPGALMKLSVEHRLFSPAFFRESLGKFRLWLDELLRETFEQCWDADLIIESPSTMAGVHVAEAVGAAYMRSFTMPWTRTKAFPQAFSVPPVDLGETYNWSSYQLFDRVFWQATSGQINRWRKYMLHLAPTTLAELQQDSIPFMYNFSQAVVPFPGDWADRPIAITGYWQLSSDAEGWQAPGDLIAFMHRARKDNKKLVYIGFGSITVSDARKMTKSLYEAVGKSDVRAIISKGWSGRGDNSEQTEDVQMPEEVYTVDSIPHDWLFPKIDIAFHHGGAGSTGASLRAGLVTLIHPFFGDQFFWAGRVQKLGAGAQVSSLDADTIAKALVKACSDRLMVERAQDVGSKIRSEDGVNNAIEFIQMHISNAKRVPHPFVYKKSMKKRLSDSIPGHSAAVETGSNSANDRSADLSKRSRDTEVFGDDQTEEGRETPDGEDADNDGVQSQSSSPEPLVTDSPPNVDGPTAKPETKRSASARLSKGASASASRFSLPHVPLPSLSMPPVPTMVSKPASGVYTTMKGLIPGTGDGNSTRPKTMIQSPETESVSPDLSVSPSEVDPLDGGPKDKDAPRELTAEEEEKERVRALRVYKNAKAEDKRRRGLMEGKLAARERRKDDATRARNREGKGVDTPLGPQGVKRE